MGHKAHKYKYDLSESNSQRLDLVVIVGHCGLSNGVQEGVNRWNSRLSMSACY